MSTTAIQATGLNKWFGEGEAKTHAVKDVNFDANFGEILYVVGPSGSGKITMLSMISGILRPNDGSVTIEGIDIWGLGNDALAEFRLHKIGFVFQDFHLFPRLTTAENVAIPLILQKRSWDEAIKEAALDLAIVGLKDKTQLPPVKLSGGEQQRVAIARAIVSRPDILILDEPTASLDGDTGRNIVKFVREHILSDKRCIVIVTHDSRIYEYADRIVKMEDGISRKEHWMRSKLIFIVSGIGLMLALISAFIAGKQPTPLPPAFNPAANPYANGIYAQGIIESSQAHGENINIYPEVSGPITEVLVGEGAHVHKGDPLLRIDESVQRATVEQQQSQAEAARTMLAELKAEPRRENLDVVTAQVDNAKATLKNAEDSLAKPERSYAIDPKSVSRDALDNARN